MIEMITVTVAYFSLLHDVADFFRCKFYSIADFNLIKLSIFYFNLNKDFDFNIEKFLSKICNQKKDQSVSSPKGFETTSLKSVMIAFRCCQFLMSFLWFSNEAQIHRWIVSMAAHTLNWFSSLYLMHANLY